ncbi:uncharacterized protein LOC116209057 [Punica granatum]|uniref:Uncharacterized protein LOC116209057 n=1 Tax=Punica granatum TaxID=22663 RepID=A0A6P8E129_PUNGR|nr:uncharacterized protein LOC116209057 [Punica granatum]
MNFQEDNARIMKMSDINEQMIAPNSGGHGHGQGQGQHGAQHHRPNTEGLPMQSSPYVKYTDLEDYKRKGYGTEGHLEPKPIQGGSGTDAPTVSGNGPPEGEAFIPRAARRNL